MLQSKCLTCHNPEKAKGGYRLHTFEALMKPGDSGDPSVTPGDPEHSQLYQLLVASDPDDRMPQKDDPLPRQQIAMVRKWIEEGAKFDGPDAKASFGSVLTPPKHPAPPDSYKRPVPILALAFSPDGEELAASGYHEVNVWSPASGVLLRRLPNLPLQIQSIAYSPDGSRLAVAGGSPGRSGETLLVEAKSGATQTLGTSADFVLSLAFNPDGSRLITGGADNTIRVYNVASGKEERRLEQHADWVMNVAFNSNGTYFASASRDKTARLFNATTCELDETYDGHANPVLAIAFSPDGRLFSAGRDKAIHIWQAKDARKSHEIGGMEGEILRLVVSGADVFSAGTDRQIRQHRIGEKKSELVRAYAGHRDTVYAMTLHRETSRLASGSYDGEVRIWTFATGAAVTNFIAAPGRRPGD